MKTGSPSPHSKLYYGAIAKSSRFYLVSDISIALRGDLIAIKHRMVIDSVSSYKPRSMSSQDFLVNETMASTYDIVVIDSSSSYHGKYDSRKV
jgi:hypothetical protein